MEFDGKTVLISGGSRGLGLELARAFAHEGADLVLLARDSKKLAEAEQELRRFGSRILTFACDVSDAQQVRTAVASIMAQVPKVDVLINNAGVIQVGPIENMDLADYQAAMGVHFWGPLYLIQEIVPQMKARKQGRIVNIASIGGKVAVPHLLPYAASKFALVGLSEGMRAELQKDGIYVTTVCPGLMRTGSHLNAFFKGQQQKEFALFAITNASPLFSTASQSAAERILEASRYGDAQVVITPQARMLRVVKEVFPGITADILGLVNNLLPKARAGEGNALKRGSESRSAAAPSVLTFLADRAALRNNEAPSAHNGDALDQPTGIVVPVGRPKPVCACTHPTHFLGRCQTEVVPPEQTCSECMENHFHPADDPTI
jgi:NAD(P)-dependent dehydrogenase (short-subunit alcohol dehydrogenase family)